MTKARKAPQKKTQQSQNRGLKIASAVFVAVGVLVILSMIVSSIFTVPRILKITSVSRLQVFSAMYSIANRLVLKPT